MCGLVLFILFSNMIFGLFMIILLIIGFCDDCGMCVLISLYIILINFSFLVICFLVLVIWLGNY